MRSVLASLAGIVVFLQAGHLALRIAVPRADRFGRAETLALAYGLGVGLLALEMLLLSLAGIRFTVPHVLAVWPMAWLAYAVWARRRNGGDGPRRPARARTLDGRGRRRTWAHALLLSPVVALIALLLFRAGFMPVWVWDSWAIWDLKARAFFHDGGVVRFLSDAYHGLAHPDYPILYPLAGTLLYVLSGQADAAVQVLPVLFYAATLTVLHAAVIRQGASRTCALLVVTGFAFLPNLLYWSQHYQAESPLLFYSLAHVAYLHAHVREDRRSLLFVAAAAAAFLTQTRAEGVLLVAPALVFLAARTFTAPDAGTRRRHAVSVLVYTSIVAAVFLPWYILSAFIARVSGGVSQVGFLEVTAALDRVPDVVAVILQWTSDRSHMGPYALLFPLSLAFALAGWRRSFGLADAFVVVSALWSVAPYVVLLITIPSWLSVAAMGRYLVVFTGITYLTFALRCGELWPSGGRSAGVVHPTLHVLAALALAVVLTSCPVILPELDGQRASWEFRHGAQGWKAGDDASVRWTAGALAIEARGNAPSFVSPGDLRLDSDLNSTIRIEALAPKQDRPGRLTLSWRHVGGTYRPGQSTSRDVHWTGGFETVALSPGWRGTVEQLSIELDGGEQVLFVRAIRSEPRWVAVLGHAFRVQQDRLVASLALSLILLGALGCLANAVEAQRVMSVGFAVVVLSFWLLPLPPSLFPSSVAVPYATPSSLVRQVAGEWRAVGRLAPERRVPALERLDGRPHLGSLLREAEERSRRDGVVIVLAPDTTSEVRAGYVYQRAYYTLYPRKIVQAHMASDLTTLLQRCEPFAALIAYGAELPPGLVVGEVAYRESEAHFIVREPRGPSCAR